MLREVLYFEDVIYRVDALMVYTSVKENPIVNALKELSAIICYDKELKGALDKYFFISNELLKIGEQRGYTGNIFKYFIIDLYINDINQFSLACERGKDVTKSTIYNMALKDVGVLKYFIDFDLKNICDNIGYGEKIYDYKPIEAQEYSVLDQVAMQPNVEKILGQLMWYYSNVGCGDFAICKTHRYDENSELRGIKNAEYVSFSSIIGYGEQKQRIMQNTLAFLNGESSDNVLLIGPAGSVKASFVRALGSEFFSKGLRIVELRKEDAYHLPDLLNQLSKRGKKIIIFVEDLSDEEFEAKYRYFSLLMDGGSEIRPSNVLFYATSNSKTDETAATAFPLTNKFNITISFPRPSQKEYLEIVMTLAKREKIRVPEEFLKEQALAWGASQNKLSGRVAKQFIDNIKWELKKN